VIVIEHHLDVVKTADWIIDLGPEGGGGHLVAAGTPETLADHPRPFTGQFLKPLLGSVSKPPARSRTQPSRAPPIRKRGRS